MPCVLYANNFNNIIILLWMDLGPFRGTSNSLGTEKPRAVMGNVLGTMGGLAEGSSLACLPQSSLDFGSKPRAGAVSSGQQV